MFSAPARAESQSFRLGMQLGVGASPFPTLLGCALTGDFYQILRFHLAGDAFGFVQGFGTGNFGVGGVKLGASVGARARIPGLKLSPTVGIEYSKTTIMGTINRNFGSLEAESSQFITPSVGAELELNQSTYLAAGVNLPWTSSVTQASYVKAEGFYPYFNLGFAF